MAEDIREEMHDVESDSSNRLAWFLTGAIIGATVAMLYAPKSGRDTRQYITDKSRDALGDTGKNIVDAGREMFERGRQLVDDAADLFERGRKLVKGS
jgi:gas vesicle protein